MQRRNETALVLAVLVATLAVVPSQTHAQAAASMPATVGELVRLEAQRALDEARKAVAAAPSPLKFERAPLAPQGNTDVVELLGISQRGQHMAADIAINGSVAHVQKGDRVGNYAIKAIGTGCIYILDPAQTELLRCVSPKKGV